MFHARTDPLTCQPSLEWNVDIIEGSTFGRARWSIFGIRLGYLIIPQIAYLLTYNDSPLSKGLNNPIIDGIFTY